MEYFTADTYTNYKRIGEPFENNGKMYVNVFENCPRCGGTGIVPPWGVCYYCGGTKGIAKSVRAYTAEEKEKMDKTKERNQQKKEEKMVAEAEGKRTEWLSKHGFNENGDTYILLGETYSIKDELKAAGWKFDKTLLWHRGDPGQYADRCFKVWHGTVMEFDIFGHQYYTETAGKLIKNKVEEYNIAHNNSKSEWVGEEKERLRDLSVTVKGLSGFDGQYGWTSVITFEDKDENIFVWFTSKELSIAIGENVTLTGTVKEHKTYKGVKQTILTRCKID